MRNIPTKRILLAAAISPILPAAALAQPVLPVNQIADVQGIRTVCRGAGLEGQQAMSTMGYPVILKVAGSNGQWLGQERLTVSGNGQSIAFQCEGPWVAMQLPPGHYRALAEVEGATPKLVRFMVGNGSRDVVIRFPEISEDQPERSDQPNSSM